MGGISGLLTYFGPFFARRYPLFPNNITMEYFCVFKDAVTFRHTKSSSVSSSYTGEANNKVFLYPGLVLRGVLYVPEATWMNLTMGGGGGNETDSFRNGDKQRGSFLPFFPL